jgi:nitrate/nitrite transporter NarK
VAHFAFVALLRGLIRPRPSPTPQGSLCDLVGPRRAFGLLMLATSLPCYAMACVTTYPEYLVCRLLIGCSLAAFVSSQYWTSSMFAPRTVGGANAIVGGWGNLGGGVTQVVTVEMLRACKARFCRLPACK